MPTIPRFHVTQDDAWLFVHVHVPYVRVSEMEFHVDGTHFSFYCKPYLLKLQFPHEVVDDELAKAVYDPNKDHGTIVVHMPKKVAGQHFEDLDLLTKLLQPKVELPSIKPKGALLIEVLSSSDDNAGGSDDNVGLSLPPAPQPKKDSTLLSLERPAKDQPNIQVSTGPPTYGFNNGYTDFFRCWHSAVSEILSLPEPDLIPADQRRVLREAAEEEQFDVERYLMDFVHADEEDMYYSLAMQYEPFWKSEPIIASALNSQLASMTIRESAPSSSDDQTSAFTDEDRELLLRLPHKEYLITSDSKEEQLALGGLVDILIGFTYDHLVTQGDSGVESTWTISIVSPTLGWLDPSDDLQVVTRSAVRRMISFPFLRHYDLAMRTLRETNELLKRGKRMVLRALLALYRIIEKSETQYLLNTLYIQDYCVWIQSVSDDRLLRLSQDFAECIQSFKKDDTGWALEQIEKSAVEACEDDKKEEEEESSEEEFSSEEESSDEVDEVDSSAFCKNKSEE